MTSMLRVATVKNPIASKNIVNAIKQDSNVVKIVNVKNAKMSH
jgi:Tfp pilus assembly PilM family ATPase